MRLLLLFAVLASLASFAAGCYDSRRPTRAPEECKVTTDPEACRKAYEGR